MTTLRIGRPIAVAGLILALCFSPLAAEPAELILAQGEIPVEQLLDVGIAIFEPGLPEEDPHAQEKNGVFPEVRKSEAKFIPFHLKDTLEKTGQWGAVRVLPNQAEGADLRIAGEIMASNGKVLTVRVTIVDALGHVWRDKRYKQEADRRAYLEDDELVEDHDPYQSLYNRIANDMVDVRRKMSPDHLRAIREVAQLKFAADLAPEVFGEYLRLDKKGRFRVERLPATGDPMLERVERIREKDYLFVDTLNEHYAAFYSRMEAPYDDWRLYSWQEQQVLQAVRREARMQKILGGLMILGSAVTDGSTRVARAARSASAIGGGLLLSEGLQKGKDAKIHVEALRELAASFDSEMEPVLVEVEGQILKLEGSAESQYAEWRRLLTDIFAEETGLPVDLNADDQTADAGTDNP